MSITLCIVLIPSADMLGQKWIFFEFSDYTAHVCIFCDTSCP